MSNQVKTTTPKAAPAKPVAAKAVAAAKTAAAKPAVAKIPAPNVVMPKEEAMKVEAPKSAITAVKADEKVVKTVTGVDTAANVLGTERNFRKTREGKVVSDKMDKTVVVLITEKKPHPLYKKTVTRSKKYKVHDEKNECGIGDVVEIMETRPMSKDKYFRLVRIIEKAK